MKIAILDYNDSIDVSQDEFHRLKTGGWIQRHAHELTQVVDTTDISSGDTVNIVRVVFKLHIMYPDIKYYLQCVEGDLDKYFAIRALNAGAVRLPRVGL